MNLNWNKLKEQSNYHFDAYKNDKMVDKVDSLGKLVGSLTDGQRVIDLFRFNNLESEIVTKHTGETEILAISDFSHINPNQQWTIRHIIVHATDWSPGQSFSFGNYIHTQWKSGDVIEFDWKNLPYSFANASHDPCVTIRISGSSTEQSDEFINRLKRFGTLQLELTENSW